MQLPEPVEHDPTENLTDEQRKELSTIQEVLAQESVEGLTVVSGFVGRDCGCDSHTKLFKTLIFGMPPSCYESNRPPGHIHDMMPRCDQRCAKYKDECLITHGDVVKWAGTAINDYMRERHQVRRTPHGHEG